MDDVQSVAWEQCVSYPDASRQTPQDWRIALHSLLGRLPKHIASHLHGLAIDGTSATVLLSHSNLAPLGAALPYNDNRAKQQAGQLMAIAPDSLGVCTATSGLAKFLWLTQHGSSESAACFLHQADWLTALLSGQPGISDYHNALKTGYDVERLRWPDWIMALPHAHLLPKVLAPGETIGYIQPDIAAHFGIHPQCVIRAGTTDSTAAFIAADVHEPGIGVTSLGTTLVLKQLS
ncbi:MAG: FGGY family carbohydrate kinase, partial [Gallionella sp.]|nr:FGGY family carbohydrate kinase [Gallionella sp.]